MRGEQRMKRANGTTGSRSVVSEDFVSALTDTDLTTLRALVESEMRNRKIEFSVGEIGERLVVEYYNSTPGLANLLLAQTGTKNVDALSRAGKRYSIKTVRRTNKTGTIYPDPDGQENVLFEYLVVARLAPDLSLRSIHEFTWEEFVQIRLWDRRMSAWYVNCSRKARKRGKCVYERPQDN